MKVLVQFGCYHCGACAKPLNFPRQHHPLFANLTEGTTHAIGWCSSLSCDRHGLRLKVPVQALECETAGQEED